MIPLVAGAVAGVAGTLVARPVAVGVVRAGLAIGRATHSAWNSVVSEAHKIHAEAVSHKAQKVAAETAAVRTEIEKTKPR
jgi:hypothetical protein